MKKDPDWTYEGIAFYVMQPQGGRCLAGLTPVYRAYNNRFASNDSNHRYSTSPPALQAMTSSGWIVEGLVFCAER